MAASAGLGVSITCRMRLAARAGLAFIIATLGAEAAVRLLLAEPYQYIQDPERCRVLNRRSTSSKNTLPKTKEISNSRDAAKESDGMEPSG